MNETYILAAIIGPLQLAILAFLWRLGERMSRLEERMAHLEGLFEGYTRRGGDQSRESLA